MAKIGPLQEAEARASPVARSSWMTSVPVMSDGHEVGGELDAVGSRGERQRASVRTRSVLARPGTPSRRQWPRAKMAIRSSLDDLVLADDDLGDLVLEELEAAHQAVDGLEAVRGGW